MIRNYCFNSVVLHSGVHGSEFSQNYETSIAPNGKSFGWQQVRIRESNLAQNKRFVVPPFRLSQSPVTCRLRTTFKFFSSFLHFYVWFYFYGDRYSPSFSQGYISHLSLFTKQTSVSSILYWGQENQQMLLTVGLCLLAAAILVAAVVVFLLRNRHIARLKLKDLTQSVDTEATRDYQVSQRDFILDFCWG